MYLRAIHQPTCKSDILDGWHVGKHGWTVGWVDDRTNGWKIFMPTFCSALGVKHFSCCKYNLNYIEKSFRRFRCVCVCVRDVIGRKVMKTSLPLFRNRASCKQSNTFTLGKGVCAASECEYRFSLPIIPPHVENKCERWKMRQKKAKPEERRKKNAKNENCKLKRLNLLKHNLCSRCKQ